MTVSVVFAIAGVIALLFGIIGGGIKAKEIEVPTLSTNARVITIIVGLVLLGITFWMEGTQSLAKDIPGETSMVLSETPEATSAPVVALKNGDLVYFKNRGHIDGPRWLDCVTASMEVSLAPNREDYSGTKWEVVDYDKDGIFSLKCLGTGKEETRWLNGDTVEGTVKLVADPEGFSGTQWRLVVLEDGLVSISCMGDSEGSRWLNGNTVEGVVDLVTDKEPYSGTKWEIVP